MKNILLLTFVGLFFLKAPLIGQKHLPSSTTSFYTGGIDSLDKHIWKRIKNQFIIESDQLFFFKVTLTSKGIKAVEDIYGTNNSVSRILCDAIIETSNNWVTAKKKQPDIIVPVFLIKEKKVKIYDPITYADFKRNRKILHCILFPPIVFTYYDTSH